MSPEIVAQLAPTGVLRAGINLSNFLLVTGKSPIGRSGRGLSRHGRAVADRLGVPVPMCLSQPGQLADAVDDNAWDIGLIGAEPQRAEKIAFTAAYTEIEATYLVPAGSQITAIDRSTVPASASRSARALPTTSGWSATSSMRLCCASKPRGASENSVDEGLDALAGPASRAADRRRKVSRRPDPRRPVHRRPAGHRHAEANAPAPRSCAIRRGGESLGRRRAVHRAAQGAGTIRRAARVRFVRRDRTACRPAR